MGLPLLTPPVINLSVPIKLLPIWQPRRFKVMHGGRGGGKSHTVAQVLVVMAYQRKLRILCVREVQKTLAQSSKQVIVDYIERLGLAPWFEVLESEIRCLRTGSTFNFSGLKDHTKDSIKSWEGADIVWVEEAHSVTETSWNVLIPTIRKPGSEIWATFNPDDETDYVYQRFVVRGDPNAWVVAINWRDNPWFEPGGEMDTERLALKALNDDLYQHVWEGKPRSIAGLLFKRHWFKRYPLGQQPRNLRNYLSSDHAGEPDLDNPQAEPDWTEHGVFGMDVNDQVWITDWWSGQEDPKVTIDAWINLIRVHKPLRAFEEKGPILRVLGAYINRAMRASGLYVVRDDLASSGPKYDRALGFAALASAGMVHIPQCDWGDRLVNQLCAFNGQDGKTDDMVDACSKFAQGLDMVIRASPEAQAVRRKTDQDIRPGAPAPFTEAYLRALEQIDAADEQAKAEFYR
jgi:predicted phage terminase large subunit-like protein